MATNLAADIKAGYRSVESCLTEEELSLVARARDPINTDALERNRLLCEVVCTYRTGPKSVWGPVVLDLLASGLVLMLQGLRPEPPVIDEEEIHQQLILEALKAAAVVPLLPGGRQTRFRLISRTYTSMLRWLAREGRRRRRQVAFESCRELPR